MWVSRFYRSAKYDSKIQYGFKALDIERDLGETACRTGFGTKPAAWLIVFIKYLDAPVKGTTVFELLTQLIELLIAEAQRTPELYELIYMTRQVSEEPTDDESELIGEEFVLDAFGPEDRLALEGEIKEHKKHASRWKGFKVEFKTWKDALSTSEYCLVLARAALFGFMRIY